MLVLVLFSAYPLTLGMGTHSSVNIFDFEFILFQSDSLSLPFAIIFHIAAVLNIIYGAHEKDWKNSILLL